MNTKVQSQHAAAEKSNAENMTSSTVEKNEHKSIVAAEKSNEENMTSTFKDPC